MTMKQLKMAARKISKQLQTDAALCDAVRKDPVAAVLRESGLKALPDGAKVGFAEGNGQVYLDVLDQTESSGELDLEDLQRVQAGLVYSYIPTDNLTFN